MQDWDDLNDRCNGSLGKGLCFAARGRVRRGRHPRDGYTVVGMIRALALSVFTCCVVGCSHGDSTKKVTEIDFWMVGSEVESLTKIIEDFHRENPEIHVRLQQIPWSAAHEKILTAFAGNATPDLCQLGNTWIPEFAELGALLELSALQSQSQFPRSDYFPGIWATNEIAGNVYGIPWYVDTRVLFYRHDLLNAAGFPDAPRSWATWREAMIAIRSQLPEDSFPILLPSNEWEQIVILGLNSSEPMLRNEGQYGNFQNAGFREACEFYLGLYRDKLAPVVAATEIANMWEEFNRGRFAMYITGPWNIGEFRKQLDPEQWAKWSTAPMPAPNNNGIGMSMAGGCSLAIFKKCKHPEQVWKLVQYLARPEIQIEFYKMTGNLPARKTAWQDAALASDPWIDAFRQQLAFTTPMPQVPEWEKIATRVLEFMDRAIRTQVAIDQVLEELDRNVDKVLSKRRWMIERRGVVR